MMCAVQTKKIKTARKAKAGDKKEKKCNLVASDKCPTKVLLKPDAKTVEKLADMKLPSIKDAGAAHKKKAKAEGKQISTELSLIEDDDTDLW